MCIVLSKAHYHRKTYLPQNVVNVICIIVRNVLTRTPVGTRLFIEQSCLFNVSGQIWWNKVVKVIQICSSCSMLCMDGLLFHLVGKRQLLVYSGAPYSNGKPGDSIGESHHKSSAQGKHSSQGATSVRVSEGGLVGRILGLIDCHRAGGSVRHSWGKARFWLPL